MEVKEKSKKRELIKTIAIVFLAVLLVLTFFSGTIMNYSLPEVATQLVSSGTINAKIRGNGTLAANESYEVMLDQTREIHSVGVKVGDKVEEGDLLFVLSDVESAELAAAQEALDKARISYQEQMLTFSKDYATDNQKVKTTREDLEKAIKERDANFVTDEEVSYAKGNLAAMEANKRATDFTVTELEASQTENDEYTTAKTEYDALKARVDALTAEIDGYEKKLSSLGGSEADYNAVRAAQQALNEAQAKWNNDYDANSDEYGKLISKINDEYTGAGASADKNITATQFNQQSSYILRYFAENPDVAKGEWNRIYTALAEDMAAIETASKALSQATADANKAENSASNERYSIQKDLSDAQGELSVVQRDLRDAQQRMDSASSANSQLKDQINYQKSVQREQEAAITELKAQVESLEAKQEAYKTAVTTVETKQRELETMLTGDDIDKKLNNLTLQSLSLEIEKQEELVEKYQKDSVGAEVHSPVSGVISSISVSAGKKTDPSTALAVIDVVDRGYIIKIPVTNEQAKQVKVGDTAEVTNYYWGSDISATLESIAPDPNSGGQKKLLVFRVSGDIDAGTNISLSVGQRSANFDALVPKSAIREDANGKFVLVVTAKSTPLGNRYTATRADVQVLAEDDTSAAVSGLSANDYVITTSSKPIDPGSQVRMVENP
ncbi:MAG: HlyD family efflux transporter periplasmic adaptor subunit [Oscillospiraceae bacterium]|jgi:multidrug efflux pump subunit AcrA (membrane-fusion protein)|nr:HlyD family efflux transporter periplasmic adaptor subunit [Oscillospiraceae bacterium]